jgi:thiamine-monophosphate kinase
MAAEPLGYLLSLALPQTSFDVEAWLEAFAAGLEKNQSQFNWMLWGGDTVSTSGPLTISVTAIGETDKGKSLSRSGANIGDNIYVSGTLGDGAGGLTVLQNNLDNDKYAHLIGRYHLPEPRLKLGKSLVGLATSAMDISDGLMGDISHICENSSVGAKIFYKKIPISSSLSNLLETKGDYSHLIWGGGDDYELLFTAAQKHNDAVMDLAVRLGTKLTCIGEITAGNEAILLNDDGSVINTDKSGYRHF